MGKAGHLKMLYEEGMSRVQMPRENTIASLVFSKTNMCLAKNSSDFGGKRGIIAV